MTEEKKEPSLCKLSSSDVRENCSILATRDQVSVQLSRCLDLGFKILPVYSVYDDGSCYCGKSTCRSVGKHPVFSLVGNGYKNATDDLSTVDSWLQKYPDMNIGLVPPVGVVVLDVDPRNGGTESLQKLESEYSKLPETLTCATGGAGLHFYFKCDASVKSFKKEIAPGIDVKAFNGYLVAPPSKHATGGVYSWSIVADITEAPDWLQKLVAKTSIALSTQVRQKVLTGGRNNYLASRAGIYRKSKMTEPRILENLLRDNLEYCQPPLDEHEVSVIAKSINKYSKTSELLTINGRVYEKEFEGGEGYITICGKPMQYSPDTGSYVPLSDELLKKRIADFLDEHIPDKSQTSNITSSLDFFKIKTHRDAAIINPPGINLRNGYLKLDKSAGKPVFKLVPHSAKYIFTYCADCIYDPSASSELLDRALDEMLDKRQQDVLMKTIAASLDMDAARIRLGRVKVLLLLGQGSNGKDTIREWVSLLFSNGFTNIGLQAFKQADNGRSFGIFDIARSKINWSSENAAISLDNCQSLKNCATGDPIQIEEKMVQGVNARARCPFIFNINEKPKLEAQQEAILSRYAVLYFPNVFKLHPDLSNPHEKQADPRLKEDPLFIKENILPALLNRLIAAFENIWEDGIDYSVNLELMESIKEDSNHLQEFINETDLKRSDLPLGLTASYIFGEYLRWCINSGYCEHDIDDINVIDFTKPVKITRYHDPSRYDRIVRSPKEMGKRLRELFPNLKYDRTSQTRTLGLSFNRSYCDFDELEI